jgi:hypothetical protein
MLFSRVRECATEGSVSVMHGGRVSPVVNQPPVMRTKVDWLEIDESHLAEPGHDVEP